METAIPSTGYSVPNLGDYALTQLGPALDEAVSLHAEFVELPLYALDIIAQGRVLPARLKLVKEHTSTRPLRYTVHGPAGLNFFRDTLPLSVQRNVFRAGLEIAAELNAIHFVIHSGIQQGPEPHDLEALYARQRDILAEFGDIAQNLGVTIVVENVFPGAAVCQTALPSRLAQEITAIDHPAVRACLDFSHAMLNSNRHGASFVDEAAALAPLAKQCHIHNSFGQLTFFSTYHRAERLAFGEGDLHMPPGLGNIPWDVLFDRLTFPASAVFILELAPHYWSDLAAAYATVRAFAARARMTAAVS